MPGQSPPRRPAPPLPSFHIEEDGQISPGKPIQLPKASFAPISTSILEVEPEVDPDEYTQIASSHTQEFSRRPTVVLCVTGSIAAYKAAEIARGLLEAGIRVIPVMTQAAEEFLGALTLSGLTGEPVRRSMWDPHFPGEMHVALAKQADAVLIAPATADTIARLAQGRADDLVTALALVNEKPLLIAPAMHPTMWAHPATKRNVALLDGDGRTEWIGPTDGPVASGDSGLGRMANPSTIVDATLFRLATKDLTGLKLVITAGPTAEDLDPVRYLTNRSSGKMGFALARRASLRGAQVTLIAGPNSLPTPHKVKRIDVRSAIAMRGAVWQAMGPDLSMADALIMSAAVSDFRPAETHASKQKKKKGEKSAQLELTLNPDILAELGQGRQGPKPVLIGFAVETDSDEKILSYAQTKLTEKRVDMIVANRASDSFGRNDNKAMLVTAGGAETLGTLSKEVLSDRILDRLRSLLPSK